MTETTTRKRKPVAPYIGLMVHYHTVPEEKVRAALVIHVNEDGTVDLQVSNIDGWHFLAHVPHADTPHEGHWTHIN